MKIELPFWPPAIVTVRVQYGLLNHHSPGSSLTALGVWLLLVLVLPLIMASASVREACPTLKPLWWSVGCFTFSLVLVAAALWFWGAVEVRGDIGSVAGLTLVGAVWLAVSQWLVSWLGLSFRDDVGTEKPRGHAGAGRREHIHRHRFRRRQSGGRALLFGKYFLRGLVHRRAAGLMVHAGIGRPGFLRHCRGARCGLRDAAGRPAIVLGADPGACGHRQLALAAATIHDFVRDGWPALLLCLVALPVELLLQPSRQRPLPAWPACGLVPVQCYVAGTVLWLWHLGRWEGMPQ